MGQEGSHIGGNDDGDRGADAKLEDHRFRYAEDLEHLVEHRHDQRAAADAEQAGQDTGDKAAGDDQGSKQQ